MPKDPSGALTPPPEFGSEANEITIGALLPVAVAFGMATAEEFRVFTSILQIAK